MEILDLNDLVDIVVVVVVVQDVVVLAVVANNIVVEQVVAVFVLLVVVFEFVADVTIVDIVLRIGKKYILRLYAWFRLSSVLSHSIDQE
jgi:hypothetical protein